ncbi:uncharacterized protein LOC126074837 [Elephas maximus indicus]|uniref:uncharacterized protein LOC126074837 n=1 Tax=Elephas maximus indicus TaxID=99487 RepID=UPI002116962F|nr:uncharacterized protein LOC126074837 [Elephas maximus indicus]
MCRCGAESEEQRCKAWAVLGSRGGGGKRVGERGGKKDLGPEREGGERSAAGPESGPPFWNNSYGCEDSSARLAQAGPAGGGLSRARSRVAGTLAVARPSPASRRLAPAGSAHLPPPRLRARRCPTPRPLRARAVARMRGKHSAEETRAPRAPSAAAAASGIAFAFNVALTRTRHRPRRPQAHAVCTSAARRLPAPPRRCRAPPRWPGLAQATAALRHPLPGDLQPHSTSW